MCSSDLTDIADAGAVLAIEDEPLRAVVYRMAETGIIRMPVVDGESRVVGVVTLEDLLEARTRNLAEERDRERVLRIGMPQFRRGAPVA